MRIDAQLCFALHAAARAFDGLYRVVLREVGLTYPQYLVMLALWEHGELSVKNLGAKLRLDSGTLSPLLKRLEAAGLLERRRAVDDERSVLVWPTAAGMALEPRIIEMKARLAESVDLDAAQGDRLRARLVQLTESLDAASARLAQREIPPK
ncbi:MarR family transcriptional regulator [Actinocrinis puniceicyclus]|uniref:MarR family transcriptional regulator n=2 Tax=Actinocrinis puniceicyclus TaxID=977794 RepID=A0A8J7WFY8_9ACTN|nr:MarR family transcriptional regulator [Actinocrinis puniceicyclus]